MLYYRRLLPAMLAGAAVLIWPATRVCAESGFTLGFEEKTLLSQDLKLLNNPTYNLTRTDHITKVTTIKGGDYFKEVDINTVDNTSATYTRSFDKLEWNSDLLYVKGSYVSEYFEAVFKMGAARVHLVGKETTTSLLTPLNGNAQTNGKDVTENIFLSLPQDFSYGFDLKGAPYQTENFLVLAAIHYNALPNKRHSSVTSSIQTSSNAAVVGQSFSQDAFTFDAITYGLSVMLALKLDHFHPYMGLGYTDGKLKVSKTTTNSADTFTTAGVITRSFSTSKEINYILLPKQKVSLVVGFTLPFETGGISLEGRIQGENSITASGFVTF